MFPVRSANSPSGSKVEEKEDEKQKCGACVYHSYPYSLCSRYIGDATACGSLLSLFGCVMGLLHLTSNMSQLPLFGSL